MQVILTSWSNEGERVNLSLQSWNFLWRFQISAIHLHLLSAKMENHYRFVSRRVITNSEWALRRGNLDLWWLEWGLLGIIQGRTCQILQWLALPLCEHPCQPHAWWEYQQHSLYLPGLQGVRMWVHSIERREAKGVQLKKKIHCIIYNTMSWKILKSSQPLSRNCIFWYLRQTLQVNMTFHLRHTL